MADTLNLKLSLSVETEEDKVVLGKMAELECTNSTVVNRLKTLEIFRIPEQEKQGEKTRYVVSVLEIYKKIHEIYPNLDINNLGETDVVIKKKSSKKKHPVWQNIKIILICFIIFCGAAFAIMGFNNDVSSKEIFDRMYEFISGKENTVFNIMHIMYSTGLAAGILVFYNHFGNKKFSTDPTPIQIELNTYEEDINHTIIDRKGQQGRTEQNNRQ